MICSVPLPPEVPVAVMVTVPVLPPRVAVGEVALVPLTLIIAELLELQLAATLELRLTAVPDPPLEVMLIEFPEQLPQVMVIACPTSTVAVPLNPLYVAVMVTELVVFCNALTSPLLLTVTNVFVVSELSQAARPVTSLVLPSSFVAIAVSCREPPAWRLFVEGLTATLETVGLTKKPVHPTATPNTKSPANNTKFRLEFQIIATPERETSAPARISLQNCSRENQPSIGGCTNV